MKDSLKNFIESNRQGFDDKQPAGSIWSKIQSRLPERVKGDYSITMQVWRAAAVLFFGLSVYLMIARNDGQPLGRDRANLQKEFTALENFYSEQIADKIELIRTIQAQHEERNFEQDIEKLDAMYQVLREQMRAHPSEKIKDALILNMLVRIDLLNQQIQNMEDAEKKTPVVAI